MLAVVAVGIYFRLAHFDDQVYWHDEAYTSLRISGFTSAEIRQNLFDDRVVSAADVLRYQHPGVGKTVFDVVHSLAAEDAQHPPLCYLMAWTWVKAFGASVGTLRSLSALIGLFVLPGLYWLCQELFNQPPFSSKSIPSTLGSAGVFTGLALALAAVSPYHLLYAQEAREFGLWTVLILFYSAAFLRALRLNTWVAWGLTAGFLAAGLYTLPLMLLVALANTVYLLIAERFRLNQKVRRGLLSLAGAILAYGPWLWVLYQSRAPGTSWTAQPIPISLLFKVWGMHVARAFYIPPGDFGFDHWSTYLMLPLLLLLVAYSFYKLGRSAPLRVWLFVLLLAASVALPLVAADLILGGQRSTSSRYLVPFYLGLLLAVAYLLAYLLSAERVPSRRGARDWQRCLGLGLTALVLGLGIASCGFNARAETAWTKVISYSLPEVARVINAAPKPLLVSDAFGINLGSVLALSHRLEPQVRLLLIGSSDVQHVPQIPQEYETVFVFNPSEHFRQLLEQQERQKLSLRFNDVHLFLWQL
ncbi:MAG TPA: hypothetical protein V6D06_17190 [Trichocoleus sp.]